jgi:hypothetical protein
VLRDRLAALVSDSLRTSLQGLFEVMAQVVVAGDGLRLAEQNLDG